MILVKMRKHKITGKVKYEVLGFVSETFKFVKHMDQQFLPSSIYSTAGMMDEPEFDSIHSEQKNLQHLEAIPRPFIHRSMEHTYFQNLYGESIAEMSESGVIATRRERRKELKSMNTALHFSGVFIKYGDSIPQNAPFDKSSLSLRGVNVERAKRMKEFLQKIFDERPMWSRRTMENMDIVKDGGKFLFSKILVYYAYSFTNGPWKVNEYSMSFVLYP